MKTGIELIKEERKRQIEVEGWSINHDKHHKRGVLGRAGSCYEVAADEKTVMPHNWPFSKKWWKPKDRIRNLVRAGALYVAESEKGLSDNDKIRAGHWDARATQVAEEIDSLQKEEESNDFGHGTSGMFQKTQIDYDGQNNYPC